MTGIIPSEWWFIGHKPCCDGNKVRFFKLELDKDIPIEELKKMTTDRDYLLFNSTTFSEDCWSCSKKKK